jgi:DNA-binding NtrC family response regulator
VNHSKRILVIDSDKKTVQAVRDALKAGYSVQVAESAEDALDLLEKEEMDLVISEGITGADFLNELREWDQELPVIFINEKRNKHPVETPTASANVTLQKPLKKQIILKTVSKIFTDRESPEAL